MSVRALSLWWDQPASDERDELVARPPLDGDTTADVVVVGAGLTGLWTAYYLLEADPGLDVLVVEREVAGFGASGRAGGWCSARFPQSAEELARRHGREAARAMRAALRDTVVEVGGVARAEGIDCAFAFGGTVTLARTPAQLARVRAAAERSGAWGDEEHALDAAGVADHVRASGVLGGSWTPDCARVQPLALTRALARVVEARGARIAERTGALRLSPRAVVTDHGTARARWIVRATEAWPDAPSAQGRSTLGIPLAMVATEPLPADVWAGIGLARAETFTDGAHRPVHGVRTPDDRLALGGHAAWFRAGSTPPAAGAAGDHERLRRALVELFPVVAGAAITHRWAGALGVPRDGHPSVGLDPGTGIGWAGGYGGDGVAAANLAGRTLADLVTGTDSPLVHLPWVGHRSPERAPGPMRWARTAAAAATAALADRHEHRSGRSARTATPPVEG